MCRTQRSKCLPQSARCLRAKQKQTTGNGCLLEVLLLVKPFIRTVGSDMLCRCCGTAHGYLHSRFVCAAGHTDALSFCSWSPDDSMLLTCGNDYLVRRTPSAFAICAWLFLAHGFGEDTHTHTHTVTD